MSNMKRYKVSIVHQTEWTTHLEAENEEEARSKAFELDGPAETAFFNSEDDGEWAYTIWEWPNVGNDLNSVDVEEV